MTSFRGSPSSKGRQIMKIVKERFYRLRISVILGAGIANVFLPVSSIADTIVRNTERAIEIGLNLESFMTSLVRRSGKSGCFGTGAQPWKPSRDGYDNSDFFTHYGSPTERGVHYVCAIEDEMISLELRSDDSVHPRDFDLAFETSWSPDDNEDIVDEGLPESPVDGFNDALREEGPLYYLTDVQRDFYIDQATKRNGLKIPDLSLASSGAIWTGKCGTSGRGIYSMIGGDMKGFVTATVEQALADGGSEGTRGMILWPSSLFNKGIKSAFAASGGDLDSVETFTAGGFSDFSNFDREERGDVFVFGVMTGRYPLRNSDFGFFHGSIFETGENGFLENGVFSYQHLFFEGMEASKDGFWVAYLPCRSLQDAIEIPLILEIGSQEGENRHPFYFPLPIAHPDIRLFEQLPDLIKPTSLFASTIQSSVAINGNVGGGWRKSSVEVLIANQVLAFRGSLSQDAYQRDLGRPDLSDVENEETPEIIQEYLEYQTRAEGN